LLFYKYQLSAAFFLLIAFKSAVRLVAAKVTQRTIGSATGTPALARPGMTEETAHPIDDPHGAEQQQQGHYCLLPTD
jgi:hypothetical protein